jgi:L-amino acid N-acyltransferase
MIIDLENIIYRSASCTADLIAIAEIYNQGIDTKISTFDDFYVTHERYFRYLKNDALGYAIVLAEYNGLIIGWSSIEPKSERMAYRFTCLGSTYLRENYRNHKIGKILITKKILHAKKLGYHSIVGEILSINSASLKLCYELGYAHVGEISEAGFRNGQWIGLTIIQKKL